MNAQEPPFEDRATWGDVFGAIIAGATCLIRPDQKSSLLSTSYRGLLSD
jgi:hypothetical protein